MSLIALLIIRHRTGRFSARDDCHFKFRRLTEIHAHDWKKTLRQLELVVGDHHRDVRSVQK